MTKISKLRTKKFYNIGPDRTEKFKLIKSFKIMLRLVKFEQIQEKDKYVPLSSWKFEFKTQITFQKFHNFVGQQLKLNALIQKT
jgi:hypothetical protein